ncbi:hypothetical protein ASG52_08305 [Methylobacterium sp. Leaf456]|uniref:hypothetical protein n=1 Tax=Methylobacterium sp. Leaf456 TaxID=1736382 RepID=UPI0006F619E8|nr:hypothetical protein [Methylobacterium sp. Leaf456]KQT50064.1 hypothetical protein ASG52_08305 [Methylobacterium sp. Leaf456]
MSPKPPIKLSVLRDIGWKEWDPIRLLADGEVWDHQPFADEYDGYLLKVAGDLRRGASLQDVIDYLLVTERGNLGPTYSKDQEARAERTARAIQAYMAELDGNGLTSSTE